MPRPAPPEPLKPRMVRLSDDQWQKFQDLGGSAWLRKFIGGKPDKYYEVFQRPASADRRQQVVAVRPSRREDFAADAPVNRQRETND